MMLSLDFAATRGDVLRAGAVGELGTGNGTGYVDSPIGRGT